MGSHDELPRGFENIVFKFNNLVMSASCYAQFKRHRMMTLLGMNYDPIGLGFYKSSLYSYLNVELLDRISRLQEDITVWWAQVARSSYGHLVADYILPQSTLCTVIARVNLREFYNICRLRLDGHAQFEIRELVGKMARSVVNLVGHDVLQQLCGRDFFGK